MLNLNLLVNHIKARVGFTHRKLELSEEAIITCLQQETLPTISTYMPFYCMSSCNLGTDKVAQNMNTYWIEAKSDEFDILDVTVVMPPVRGMNSSAYMLTPIGADYQTIIGALTTSKFASTLNSVVLNPETWQFLPPNQLRVYSTYSLTELALVLKTTHRKDFSTLPIGASEVIKKLAYYDVMMDVFGFRKYFSQLNTAVAQINLNMDELSSIPDKRDELIERLRKEQLKYSPTKKIYVA
jgi:hypothetical protein